MTRENTGKNNCWSSPDFFPILPWEPLHGWTTQSYVENPKQGLESIAECNFTMAGFVLPPDLPKCEELGLRAIAAPDLNWNRSQNATGYDSMSDEQIDAYVHERVKLFGNSPALAGYFINDEPGTERFPVLGKVVSAFRKHAPDKLAYLNLFPVNASKGTLYPSQLNADSYDQYLEKFLREVEPQFLSWDNYAILYSDDLKKADVASLYFRNLLDVRRFALQENLPFWNTICSVQIRPWTTVPSPANISLQAYTSLAAGARGISWFRYNTAGYTHGPIGAAGQRTPVWGYLKSINHQIRTLGPVCNRLRSTGVFFTEPIPWEKADHIPGQIVKKIDADGPMMVGEFESDDGAPYIMIVNLSLDRSVSFTVTTNGGHQNLQYISSEDGSLFPLTEIKVEKEKRSVEQNRQWLTAGQGILIQVS